MSLPQAGACQNSTNQQLHSCIKCPKLHSCTAAQSVQKLKFFLDLLLFLWILVSITAARKRIFD